MSAVVPGEVDSVVLNHVELNYYPLMNDSPGEEGGREGEEGVTQMRIIKIVMYLLK